MKKIAAWIIIGLMLAGTSALATEEANPEGLITIYGRERVEDTVGLQAGSSLTIGTNTEPSGYFATELFGMNTTDMDVRSLLHGYATVEWTRTLGLAINGMAVRRINTTTDGQNNRTYTIEIADDLTYNDGTQVTAADYVFSLLLSGAPEIERLGGTPIGLDHLLGYEAYRSGASREFTGVRLLSDTMFSLTVRAEYLPYFYGLAMLNVTPYPMRIIAPGCEIWDDGAGVYIAAGPDAATLRGDGFTPGEFSEAMLRVTLLDEENGYVKNPRVTSGPYSLESYDRATGTVRFTVNERYNGNYEGQRPHIERLELRHVPNDSMIEALRSGQVDVLNKVSNNAVVAEGLRLSDDEAQFRRSNYARTGFSYLAFACEDGPTSRSLVRQAVARCVDKQALVNGTIGSLNGIPVNGYYGLGQWMINQSFGADAATGADELNVLEELSYLAIPMDLEEAEALLVQDGWTLNAAGEPYVKGTDAVRYREENGALLALTLSWAKTEQSAVADMLEVMLREAFREIGIGFEVTEMPFGEMLTYYHRQQARTYDLFLLGTNFNYIFDPYYDFSIEDKYQGAVNTSGLRDTGLMELAWQMRETPTTEIRMYVERWLAFQRRFVEMMPMVPLYSNVYFDFYPNDLQGYGIAEYAGWALAIPYARFGEEVDAEYLQYVDFGTP